MNQQNNEIIQALENKVKVLQDILRTRDIEVKAALDDLRVIIMALSTNPKSLDFEASSIPEARTSLKKREPRMMQEPDLAYRDELRLIEDSHSVLKGDKHVSLTTREFVIFEYLYKNADKPVTREQLLEQFSEESEMTARNIDVHIFSLRKKVQKVGAKIETVWGTGYKLVKPRD